MLLSLFPELLSQVENPLDNYKIEQTIGKGTFGKVFLGLHRPTRQRVAIKILEKNKIENEGDFTRIQREIHILRKMRHPNIVQLYEILESESKIYLIMEYVDGGELFQKIVKSRRLQEQEAAQMFGQLIRAIEYLSGLKIAHRDLKPENLLLTDSQTLKVVDFGLSNIYSDLLTTPCGSPCYAAPEMVSGLRYNGLKTDIWAAGVVMYAMLCGCVPFEDPNTRRLYEKIKHNDFIRPAHLSPVAIDLLQGLLHKQPEHRLTIAKIKNHPFMKTQILRTVQYVDVINEDIIKTMGAAGIDQQKCKEMVRNNKHNSVTTTYYLMLNYLEVMNRKKRGNHFSNKSMTDKPIINDKSGRLRSISHVKAKSQEQGKLVENKRIVTDNEQINVKSYLEAYRRERVYTQHSHDYSSFRQTISSRLKDNSVGRNNAEPRRSTRSPQMYVDYKLKTVRN